MSILIQVFFHKQNWTSYYTIRIVVDFLELWKLMEKDVVVAIGPQSSGIAHVISHVVNELHVPLLSFAATDRSLAALQYPYFLRTTQSDYFQMYAIADLVEYYGWREEIAIFVDDDYGRSGISILDDALAIKRAKISYKAPFTPKSPNTKIRICAYHSIQLVLATSFAS